MNFIMQARKNHAPIMVQNLLEAQEMTILSDEENITKDHVTEAFKTSVGQQMKTNQAVETV